ncbi:necdin-like 2 [Parambassis ranga]|uniref:Non-structural maintenance of chromosomes element 3 homolog n=1 Tax=Parambassis ranga TaxID=210632 RepID=A0A6P7IJQ2_9TELE|nr:non-structural maintenance of chromosomes element 3 homolog [Parambassis ranga]XP_028265006.1 non-structural maintenance of chromosomes element 3 homolog [Parambassis ranga]XP_028265007.1 non-structural maintenance of chromosomes element 3 homolog [Parambassis ranga]
MTQRNRLSHTQSASQSRRQPSTSAAQEEDDDTIFTQPSSTQVQKGLEKLTAAEVERKVAEVVQYFLVKDQKKVPVRRAELVKNVVKEYRNVYPEIIKRTARTLDQVFGLKLVEIDSKNHMYILVNNLEPADGASPINSPTSPKMGLLFVILSVVFMKGGVVRENLIWNTLKKLRVDPGEKHEEFGDVKRLVTDEFVRQRYLEYARIPHTEPIEHEFRWGQRADAEVSKAKILEFLGQLFEQEPQSWSQQYKEAHSSQASSSSQR